MSIRVLNMLVYTNTTLIQRPTDDLESFIWVLIWAILGTPWAQHGDKMKPQEQEIYKSFRSTSLTALGFFKTQFFNYLRGNQLPSIIVFRQLLTKWFQHASSVSDAMFELETEPSDPLEFYKPIYAKYLSIGFGALDTLPDNWNF
ncbi:MAG TPA: hypothetical protein VGO47_08120 [Chlamydiales bacterium]|nr:hypothetical protein [Chlamydiales bacterium]